MRPIEKSFIEDFVVDNTLKRVNDNDYLELIVEMAYQVQFENTSIDDELETQLFRVTARIGNLFKVLENAFDDGRLYICYNVAPNSDLMERGNLVRLSSNPLLQLLWQIDYKGASRLFPRPAPGEEITMPDYTHHTYCHSPHW